jgi:hypothetical protein
MKTKAIIGIGSVLLAGTILAFILKGNVAGEDVKTGNPTINKQSQAIVVLDLSDRVLENRQRAYDSTIVIEVFNQFEIKAKSKLLINCKDKFQVLIAEQADVSAYDPETETDLLTLDFSSLKAAEKVNALNVFKSQLPKKLSNLFQKARFSANKEAYKGAQIWKTFNSSLAALTAADKETQLVILTDGYFDFEAGEAVLKQGNFSTQSSFLNTCRNDQGINQIKNGTRGILKLDNQLRGDIKVLAIGLRSKFKEYLKEEELLKALWENWLLRNGLPANKVITAPYASLHNAKSTVKQFFTF